MERNRQNELKGTTRRVYFYIIRSRNKPVRITDIQTGLRFSSPSLAHYHIKKLMELGLVREEGAGYTVDKVTIENYFLVRGRLVPFQAAYVSFFIVTLAAMLTILGTASHVTISSLTFLALVVNIAALIISAYELRRTREGMT
jgi:hypothetical protein